MKMKEFVCSSKTPHSSSSSSSSFMRSTSPAPALAACSASTSQHSQPETCLLKNEQRRRQNCCTEVGNGINNKIITEVQWNEDYILHYYTVSTLLFNINNTQIPCDCCFTHLLTIIQSNQHHPYQLVTAAAVKETPSIKDPLATHGPIPLSRPPPVITTARRRASRTPHQRYQEEDEKSNSDSSSPSEMEEDDEDTTSQGNFSLSLPIKTKLATN